MEITKYFRFSLLIYTITMKVKRFAWVLIAMAMLQSALSQKITMDADTVKVERKDAI